MGCQPDGDHGKDPGDADRVGRILEGGAHPRRSAAVFGRDRVHDGGGIGGDEHPHAHADHQDGQGKGDIDEVGRYQQQPDEAQPP